MSEVWALAGAAYSVTWHTDWAALEAKLSRWVRAAVSEGAEILVFPEYAALEAACLQSEGDAPSDDVSTWYRRAADRADSYVAMCRDLARAHGVWILSGSGPATLGSDLVNRAWLIAPDGASAPIDKQILTPWERTVPGLRGGAPLIGFDTELGRIGVLICYDSEFPALAEVLAPDLLLVPCCTETLAGQTRVRNAVRARALEGQCATVQAPLVGHLHGCPVIDTTVGQACVAVPPDHPFPMEGLLADRDLNAPGWAVAKVARSDLTETRQNGGVAPRADLAQARACAAQATVTSLPKEQP